MPPVVAVGDGAAPTVAQHAISDPALPTGASPEASYYEPPPSRTGWYALAVFFALIALGIGGILLFQALSGNDDPSSFALPDYVGQPLNKVIVDLNDRGPATSQSPRRTPPSRSCTSIAPTPQPGPSSSKAGTSSCLLQPASRAAGGAQRRGPTVGGRAEDPRGGRIPGRHRTYATQRRRPRGVGDPHRPAGGITSRPGHADQHRRVRWP